MNPTFWKREVATATVAFVDVVDVICARVFRGEDDGVPNDPTSAGTRGRDNCALKHVFLRAAPSFLCDA